MPADSNGFSQRYSTIIQTVTVVALFIGGFWGAVIGPIAARQEKLEVKLEGAISRAEHEEFKLRIDRDIARIDADRLRDKTAVVPRSEHDARWSATDKDLKLLSERLNELRTATTSTYTTRDEIQRLQAELTELRSIMAAQKAAPK